MEMQPIDLCIWTYNGEKTLDAVLDSIVKCIPAHLIGKRIAQDDGSTDKTVRLLQDRGWEVGHNTERLGPARNAAKALARTTSTWVACFEQDVVVNPLFYAAFKIYRDNVFRDMETNYDNVMYYYGMRFPLDETAKNFEIWRYRHGRISIDNAFIHHELLATIGEVPVPIFGGLDSYLVERVREYGWRHVLMQIASKHLHDTWKESIKHMCAAWKRPHTLKEKIHLALSFIVSPIRAIQIAYEVRDASMLWFYPYLRLSAVLSA